MFENVLYQDATSLLTHDITNATMPKSILLAGPPCSGKLTTALEIARVLSCTANPVGEWLCRCPSCLKHKSLSSTDVLIAGSRNCMSEISGAQKALLDAYMLNAPWIQASRYLFVRSVRKLTNRFNQVLWEDDDKASKISPLIASIDEILEELDPLRQEPIGLLEFEKCSAKLIEHCTKLENTYLYDSVPIAHIRRAQTWAHYTIASGKRVLIIEHADRMQEAGRNALLKILEEPPEHSVFILTTENRNAVMPTILSRLRTYSFTSRVDEQNAEVLKRIFRIPDEEQEALSKQAITQGETAISAYLNSFLPISPNEIAIEAQRFIATLQKKEIPNLEDMLKSMKNFEPRSMLKIFFNAILDIQRKEITLSSGQESASATEQSAMILESLKVAYTNITIYNQSITAAFEALIYSILKVKR